METKLVDFFGLPDFDGNHGDREITKVGQCHSTDGPTLAALPVHFHFNTCVIIERLLHMNVRAVGYMNNPQTVFDVPIKPLCTTSYTGLLC